MKKLILILGLVFSASCWAQNLGDYFDPVAPNSGNAFDANVEYARTKAIEWLDAYYKKFRSDFVSDVKSNYEITYMIEGIKTVGLTKINRSKVSGQTYCDEKGGLLGFVSSLPSPFRVFYRLCDKAFKMDWKQLAQLLIHESYHVSESIVNSMNDHGQIPIRFGNTPVSKEVKAVSYELAVLYQIGGGCKYTDSGYFDLEPYATALNNADLEDIDFCPGYKNKQNFD